MAWRQGVMICPNENQLAAFAGGDLDGEPLVGLEEHLESCGDCRELVLALGSASHDEPPTGLATTVAGTSRAMSTRSAARGAIGRFEITGELGRGGMGVVHEAHDPTLDRRVAIKLVRGGSGGLRADARDRLLREARSLARLSHVNVVPIHEAGLHDGELYIAMERIDGEPLDAWLAARPRDWREVLRVFAAAGEGLAAAHASDMVHRDFKPGNVMVCRDRAANGDPGVKVVDFGLARASSFDPAADEADDLDHVRVGDRLTITGRFVGTPAYASPEQLRGADATPRSDIFSFFVALFEALTGHRPFTGSSRAELIASIEGGVSRAALREIPRPLRSIVAAGLRADPDARPRSMPDVTAALRATARRAHRWAIAGGTAVVIAAAALALVYARGDDGGDRCDGLEVELRGVWDISTRAAVARALLESQSGVGRERLLVVAPVLDDYSDRWLAARTAACRATALRGEQSSQLSDLRLACYRRRLADLRATTALLAAADADIVRRSIDVVSGLPSLDECADADRLLAREPGPVIDPAVREELESNIAASEARSRAGQHAAGLALAVPTAHRASELDHPALVARAHEVLATLYVDSGELENGMLAYKTALFAAVSGRDSGAEARLAGDLARELTSNQVDRSLAASYADHCRAALRRVRSPDARATALVSLAGHHFNISELDRADTLLDEALELSPRIDMPRRRAIRAAALALKGGLADQRNQVERARDLHEQALALRLATYGRNHELVATSMEQVGHALRRLGDEAGSLERFREVWRIRETLAGDVNAFYRLQVAVLASDDPLERERLAREAVAAALELYGADHPTTGSALDSHAETLVDVERWPEAIESSRRAVRVLGAYDDALGPSALAMANLTLASAYHGAASFDDALAATEQASAIMDRNPHTSPDERFVVLLSLADNYSTQRRWDRACPVISEIAASAEAIRVLGSFASEARTYIEMMQQICAWELEKDESAISRVETLLAELRPHAEEFEGDLDDVDAWLVGARAGKRGLAAINKR